MASGGGRPTADFENCIFAFTAFTLRRNALAANWLGREGAFTRAFTCLHGRHGVAQQRIAGNALPGVSWNCKRGMIGEDG